MIKIHISFWLAAVLFWAIGLGVDFIMVAAAVTAHELAHMLCAKSLGCQIKQMHISALGEMSVLGNMDRLAPTKRLAIIIAGPACNFIMGIIAWQLGFEMFAFYNFILCGFNLLPIFPLDGARLAQLFLGNSIGIMPANRLILKAGFICCLLLMGLGIVQAILYAPNFTMLCMGFVLWRRNRSLHVELTGEFYLAMLNKAKILYLPAKVVYAQKKQPIAAIVDAMGWDNILMVIYPDNSMVNEKQIMDYVLQHGISGTLEEVFCQTQT
jgi:stage IV sporulation protein FB